MIALVRYLANNYGVNERVTSLLDNLDIHVMPSMNPDGFEKRKRWNANTIDLNRNFPSWSDRRMSREERKRGREPEVKAVMDWVEDNPFVLSINFHDGAVVANYPWDDWRSGSSWFRIRGKKVLTPDNNMFRELAELYANKHTVMHKGLPCQGFVFANQDGFANGITNGAEWFVVRGGLQDYNYIYSNCMEITLELSCIKFPDKRALDKEWKNNKEALLSYLVV